VGTAASSSAATPSMTTCSCKHNLSCNTAQPAGCTTPGSAIRVEASQLHGVDSSGMICSAHDLGWSEEADSVPAFVPKSAPLGSPYPDEPFRVRKRVPVPQSCHVTAPRSGRRCWVLVAFCCRI